MFYRIKKKKKNRIKVTFRLPAEKAATTPVLAQVIGQFGFNIQEFLLTFNKKSNLFIENIETKTIVYIHSNKKWKIFVDVPTKVKCIKNVTNILRLSKISKICSFLQRKIIRNKYRYKLIQCKYWRVKITLRHLYNILLYYRSIENTEILFDEVKSWIRTMNTSGIYICKLKY